MLSAKPANRVFSFLDSPEVIDSIINLSKNDIQKKAVNGKERKKRAHSKTHMVKDTVTLFDKVPLGSVLNDKDFDLIDELVTKCAKPNEISRKMDYFYGSTEKYHKLGDCQPILPLNFETGESCTDNANQNWGNLAKVILEGKPDTWKDLIKSITGDIHSKLKELCLKVQESKFKKVLKLIDELLKKEMDSWQDRYKKPHESEEQKKLRSCITLLMLLNKGKLEDIILSSRSAAKKNYAKDQFTRKMKILERNTKFDALNFSRYFPRPSSKSRRVPLESKSSKAVP